ncbi:Dihydrofolate reductase type 3 [invertebrate metagenome]|uniref:dihydrofolate reductase n=1 Tax=invertebrate metagenome TaxID=1711999 RepID=A0A2H9T7F8_9ZZZZ
MKLAIIAAVAENNAIGINNKLPWYLPGDLRYFKAVTMGKPVIMGRKTFESLRKPLPGRTNIVITHNKAFTREGIQIVYSLPDAISLAEDIALINGNDEIIVMGGAEIYRQALPETRRLYLTRVNQSFKGDTFFPDIDDQQWEEVAKEDHEADDGQLNYSYVVLDRR